MRKRYQVVQQWLVLDPDSCVIERFDTDVEAIGFAAEMQLSADEDERAEAPDPPK